MSLVDKQLSYKKVSKSAPMYKLEKKVPVAGNVTVDLTPSGGLYSEWTIAPQVWNPARTILSFISTPANTTNDNVLFANCMSFIRSLELNNSAGVEICRLQNVNFYTKVVMLAETRYSDFLNFDQAVDGTAQSGLTRMFQRITQTATSLVITATAACTSSISTLMVPNSYLRQDGGNLSSLNEPQQLFLGGAGATPIIRVSYNLGLLYNTFFAVDKPIYFPEQLTMRIYWSPVTEIGFDLTGVTAAVLTTNNALSSIYLYLCVQRDPEINAEIKAQVSQGMSLLIGHVRSDLKAHSASTTQNVINNYSAADGLSLVKIYHAVFTATVTTTAARNVYNHSFVDSADAADAKVSEYWTALNGQRLQDVNLDTSAHENYLYLRDMLKGSCVLSAQQFSQNAFHVDNFSSEMVLCEQKDSMNNVVQGLPLAGAPVQWEFNAITANTAWNHRTFAIFQRNLFISPAGVEVRA
jgi:hypothetical protein